MGQFCFTEMSEWMEGLNERASKHEWIYKQRHEMSTAIYMLSDWNAFETIGKRY